MPRQYQGSMAGGEADASVWGRIDLERYQQMVRVGRNVIFLPEGGAMKRPGLEFIAFAHGSVANINASIRPIPFKFNNDQTYVLCVQSDRIFFVKDGGVIVEAREGSGTIAFGQDGSGTFISASGGGMTYAAGDILVFLSGGPLELQNRWVRVAASPAPTASKIYLLDYLTGAALPTSGWSNTGTPDYGKIYTVETADGWYSAVDVMELDYTQSNDKIFFSHPSGKTKVVTRTGDTAWTISDFDPAPNASSPSVSISSYADGHNPPAGVDEILYAVTAIETDNGTYEESLAALLTVDSLASDDPSYIGPSNPKVDADLLSVSDPVQIEWSHVPGCDKYRVYKALSGIYGLVGLAEGTSGTISFRDTGYAPNLTFAPPLEADIFDAANGYPGAVELAQQRIWFGRTNNLIRDVYASRAGSLSSFATSTVGTDDDPIELAIAAKAVNEVRFFVPLKDLVIMTSDGEWGFDTGQDGIISVRSGLIAHSFWGSARVKPAIVGDSALFVEKSERIVRDLAFALQSDGFASSNLTLFAKHLFRNRTLKSICFAQSPFNVMFGVMSDGQGVFCTYVRDQQIFAWSRVDTNGRMRACCSLPESGRDNVYVAVERTYNSTTPYKQIERMTMIDPEFAEQGIWLDNSIEYNRPNQYLADPYDGECTNAQTVEESGVLTLRLNMPENQLTNNELMQFQAADGSPLSALDGLVFMVEQVNNPSGGREDYKLYRTINASTSDKRLFDAENYLPKGFFAPGVVGYFNDGVGEMLRAHHLNYRAGLVAIRADHNLYEGQTLSAGGRLTFTGGGNPLAGKVHAGETYLCEIETLDLDSFENPVTGLPMQIGDLQIRYSMMAGVEVGRRRDDLYEVPLSVIQQQADFSLNRGVLRGILQSPPYPEWRNDGRIVIRSEDAFPFIVSAIIPTPDVGVNDVP